VLALIPQDEVLGIWGILKNSVPSVLHKPSMHKFIKYFETHYMNGCFAEMWNHYETEGPKTNDQIEGYNLCLKKKITYEKDPNIFRAVELFQKMDQRAYKKYLNAVKHSKDDKKPIATMSRADASRRDLFKSLKEQRIHGQIILFTIRIF